MSELDERSRKLYEVLSFMREEKISEISMGLEDGLLVVSMVVGGKRSKDFFTSDGTCIEME